MSLTPRKYLIPCLVLVVLMGAGCRGSDRRSEEPTPAYPFGDETPVTPEVVSERTREDLSACANEYYPLRAGYSIEYRTEGADGRNTSQLNVTQVRGNKITLQSRISRQDAPPLETALEYECINGSLVAQGYVDAVSVTSADGTVARGATIETLSSEGQFMPARVSDGQTWGAKYNIRITPTDRPDVLQERAAAVKAEVAINRIAIGKETVTVPAGRFEAMKIASNTSFNGNLAYTGYEWWVKGKGMVKSVQGAGTGAITTEATSVRTSSR
ncbi:hypothetical protein KBD61_01910 [Patescibacteria group bacterium]|nr:hypothetical protein [Patescibacteria group bacterium]MBP9709765.1 hypothetical protein [Patescibacteria group bacterium]